MRRRWAIDEDTGNVHLLYMVPVVVTVNPRNGVVIDVIVEENPERLSVKNAPAAVHTALVSAERIEWSGWELDLD